MDGVLTTPLRRILTPAGDVLHGMRSTDPTFAGFGEAYFSMVLSGHVKGWKRHAVMTVNLVVPSGAVQVSIHDATAATTQAFVLCPDDEATCQRLTIAPGLWVAFGGIGRGSNVMLNVASIPHDPAESTSVGLDVFPWHWIEVPA